MCLAKTSPINDFFVSINKPSYPLMHSQKSSLTGLMFRIICYHWTGIPFLLIISWATSFCFVKTWYALNWYAEVLCTSSDSTFVFSLKKVANKIQCIIWASNRENQSSGVYHQQRCRPACPSAQSDQRLCHSLVGKYHI